MVYSGASSHARELRKAVVESKLFYGIVLLMPDPGKETEWVTPTNRKNEDAAALPAIPSTRLSSRLSLAAYDTGVKKQ